MLGHPVFRAKIREWLKVYAQSELRGGPGDAEPVRRARSGILDVLIESCPTKIFLPNEEAGPPARRSIPGHANSTRRWD